MRTLRIRLKDWGRRPKSRTGGAGHLYDTTSGKMCCMGFYCEKLGKTKDEMSNRSLPTNIGIHDLDDKGIELPHDISSQFISGLSLQSLLWKVNDRDVDWRRYRSASAAEQRSLIARLFKLVGYRVIFE